MNYSQLTPATHYIYKTDMKTEHNEREHVDRSDPKPDKVTGNKRKATSETISFLYIYINI